MRIIAIDCGKYFNEYQNLKSKFGYFLILGNCSNTDYYLAVNLSPQIIPNYLSIPNGISGAIQGTELQWHVKIRNYSSTITSQYNFVGIRKDFCRTEKIEILFESIPIEIIIQIELFLKYSNFKIPNEFL